MPYGKPVALWKIALGLQVVLIGGSAELWFVAGHDAYRVIGLVAFAVTEVWGILTLLGWWAQDHGHDSPPPAHDRRIR